MKAVLGLLKVGEFVFPFTATHLRMVWNNALKAFGIKFIGPLHNLRHA